MEYRLKPCPYCGESEVQLIVRELSAYVACPIMGCWMQGPMKETADAAAKAWNDLPRAFERSYGREEVEHGEE